MSTRTVSSLLPIRGGRFNPWFFDRFDGVIDHYLHSLKLEVFRGLPDTIVEIGPGVGANFRYYRPGTRVLGIEPNPAMHSRLIRNASTSEISLELSTEWAEFTGLAGNSFGAVVSTMVLCTVRDLEAAVKEAIRLLEDGGRFIFVEHVKAEGRALRNLQRLLAVPWQRLFEGCQLERDTMAAISTAGFRRIHSKEQLIRSPFLPVNRIVAGVATK